MFLREVIMALAQVVDLVIQLYIFIIIGRAIISWVNPDPYNPIVRFLHNATEPVFYRVRRLVPMVFGGFDLTPLVLLIALTFLQRVIKAALIQIAYTIS
ncbi:MAG: YggT family protein [Desulfuromonas sp.]|nr:MAG: YggT family protein [Desulfuromonas sp.]